MIFALLCLLMHYQATVVLISEPLAINVALFGLVPHLLPTLPQSIKARFTQFITSAARLFCSVFASPKAESTTQGMEINCISMPRHDKDEAVQQELLDRDKFGT